MASDAGSGVAKKQKHASLIAPTESWEDQGNCITSLTLEYLTPLLRKGTQATLEAPDVGRPRAEDLAGPAFQKFDEVWQQELQRPDGKPSVMRAQMLSVGRSYIATALGFYTFNAAIQFVPVLFLNILVQHFEGSGYENLTLTQMLLISVALLVLPVCGSVSLTKHDVMMLHAGVRSRTAVSVAVYRHALKLTSAAKQGVSTGEVVNLFSNDALKVELFMKFLGFIFIAPIQIGLCLWLIYSEVGEAMFVGLGFMIFLIPIQGVVFGTLFAMQKKFVKLTDKRVGIMNEILSGIRVVKYYGWEEAFKQFVTAMRRDEISVLTRIAYVVAVGFSLVLLSAPIIQPILIFATYTEAEGKSIDAATAFTTIALFNLLRFPFAFLPFGFMQYLNCKVASQRLTRFLTRSTITEYVDLVHPSGGDKGDGAGSATATSAAALELRADATLDMAVVGGNFSWGVAAPLMPREEPAKPRRRGCCGRRRSPPAAPEGRQPVPTTDLDVKTKSPESTDVEMVAVAGDEINKPVAVVSASEVDLTVAGTTKDVQGETPEEVAEEEEAILSLTDVNVRLKKGSLIAVVGPVGSGKSSLLAALTGEMQRVDGSVARRADCSIAFAAQVPWIVNRTLKENVLFHQPYDAGRYEHTIAACCLDSDLAILPAGDETEIGEKGINLSGGQKARVALARAAYSQADLYLFDDPLSAVDAHVGKSIFEHCICGMLAQKTRVLVTHQVHVLERCDEILVMDKGHITAAGTFQELLAQQVPIVVSAAQSQEQEEGEKVSEVSEAAASEQAIPDQKDIISGVTPRGPPKKGGQLTSEEERKVGNVSSAAYSYYAQAGGWTWVFTAVLFMFAGRTSEVLSTFWLSDWADASLSKEEDGEELSASRQSHFLLVYALLGIGGVLGLTFRALSIAKHRLGASQLLHANLVDSILAAPVAFFDVTPMGRVLNRFAADIQTIDIEISQSISQLAGTFTNVIGALGAIAGATKGTFLVLLGPLLVIYYRIQSYFRRTSTEVERLAKISRSPIFSDFSQSLAGASSIRAYAAQPRFISGALEAMDMNNACVIIVQLCFSWLSIRLDIIGAVVLFFIVLLTVLTRHENFVPAGWLGLALAFAIELTGFLKHAVRMMAAAEGQMASVERIMTYTDDIDAETPVKPSAKAVDAASTEQVPPAVPDAWPAQGVVAFQDVVMGYRDGPDVLKGISFSCKAMEKVGIVGRTGSGKSSLLVALFRMTELREGQILIDGKDIAQVPLSVLRNRLCIIPQDPVMFSSTVRFNLDPFDEHTDDDVWQVLRKCQLASVIEELPHKLAEPVAEGGENFSVGQRQLICIARALLRKPRVLVLDEATASIDNETDAVLQSMIREEFREVTVLTIAHRLHTIIDSDRVLVLDDGHVREYDTPKSLLADSSGIFYGMVEAANLLNEE